jgi:hypothetical protein
MGALNGQVEWMEHAFQVPRIQGKANPNVALVTEKVGPMHTSIMMSLENFK